MEQLYKERIRFTQISNDIIQSVELSCKAKAVYCYLFSRPEGWVFYRSEISDNFKEGKNTISGAIKELEEFGVLSKRQSRDGGMYKGCEYFLSAGISTVTQKTVVGKTDVGKTVDHESATNNTNTSNTDLTNTDFNIKPSKSEKDEAFEFFYSRYPRKVNRQLAAKSWGKLSHENMQKAIAAVESEDFQNHMASQKTARGDFRPHPSSWLNAGGWDNEYEVEKSIFEQTDGEPF